jgi:hypothetical protein
MKRVMSADALIKEAAFWDELKKVAIEHPGKACQK